jgi:Fe2+ transport system protein FeoA
MMVMDSARLGFVPFAARLAPLTAISGEHGKGVMLEMPPPDDLRRRLEALGISDSSRVVVYYGKDWGSPATRVVFTLDYAGLGALTSLLDGGMGAWIRAGQRTTDLAAPEANGSLAPLKIRPIVVTAWRAEVLFPALSEGASAGEQAAFARASRLSRYFDGTPRKGAPKTMPAPSRPRGC